MKKTLLAAALLLGASTISAQTPAHDPTDRLREVLPAEAFARVQQRIADARARELPAQALAHRALELSAKGATPVEIEQRVSEYSRELGESRAALRDGGRAPSDDEVEAGAEVLSKGVSGAAVSELAREAPSGRSLAVPLGVMAQLIENGNPAAETIAVVLEKLQGRASDEELRQLPSQAADRGRPEVTGRELGESRRPAVAGRPAGIPANPGQAARPAGTPGGSRPVPVVPAP